MLWGQELRNSPVASEAHNCGKGKTTQSFYHVKLLFRIQISVHINTKCNLEAVQIRGGGT